jgi:hypothetical protein
VKPSPESSDWKLVDLKGVSVIDVTKPGSMVPVFPK